MEHDYMYVMYGKAVTSKFLIILLLILTKSISIKIQKKYPMLMIMWRNQLK